MNPILTIEYVSDEQILISSPEAVTCLPVDMDTPRQSWLSSPEYCGPVDVVQVRPAEAQT